MKEKDHDDSFKSISIIEKKFSEYLNKKIWVPDWGEEPNPNDTTDYDVVLMGSFFSRIFQSHLWPNHEFHLFCLSTKTKKALNELIFLNQDYIGLISRYHLFPKSTSWSEFNFNSNTHFFYSGKISARKNIEFLIFTVFHLQIIFSKQIKLTLLGDFDNSYHTDILGLNYIDYRFKITQIIDHLPWIGEKPRIISGLGEFDWINQADQNALFISTSDFISDDFSVSAAQIQEKGFPLLIPNWGGFSDVRGINVKHFPVSFICNSHQSLKSSSEMALKFATTFTDENNFETLPEEKIVDFIPSKKLSRKILLDIFDQNVAHWGSEINLIREGKMADFSKSENGQFFLKALRKIYS